MGYDACNPLQGGIFVRREVVTEIFVACGEEVVGHQVDSVVVG